MQEAQRAFKRGYQYVSSTQDDVKVLFDQARESFTKANNVRGIELWTRP